MTTENIAVLANEEHAYMIRGGLMFDVSTLRPMPAKAAQAVWTRAYPEDVLQSTDEALDEFAKDAAPAEEPTP